MSPKPNKLRAKQYMVTVSNNDNRERERLRAPTGTGRRRRVASTWQRRTKASPPPSCVATLHPPSQCRSNRGRKLQLSLSTSLSSPAAKKRDIANPAGTPPCHGRSRARSVHHRSDIIAVPAYLDQAGPSYRASVFASTSSPFPSRISKDGATSAEIGYRLLHLRSPSPLSISPPPDNRITRRVYGSAIVDKTIICE
uniref:Uncharacterized protein n=1 Tax=Oryza barthii TaxID=65489 RepID=A0A0D3FQH5_9ORYZ